MNTQNTNGRPKPPAKGKSGLIPWVGPLWSWVIIAVVGVIVVFGLAVLIEAGVSHNKIHSGITIAGQDVGGMTRDDAVAALTKYLNKVENEKITLTSDDSHWDVSANDLGTQMDIDAAVTAAYNLTRENNGLSDLGKRWKLLFKHEDIPLAGTIDSTKMDAFLAQVAQELDQPAVDAKLVMNEGQTQVVDAEQGLAVDQDGLKQQITDLVFAFKTADIEVPLVVTQPTLTADQLQPVLDQVATMVGSPVQLVKDDQSWTFTPEQLSGYLDVRQEEQKGASISVPFFSADKMADFFTSIQDLVATAPVDASFAHDGTKAWVVPGVDGEKLDPEKTAAAITEAAKLTSDRVAQVVVMAAEPDLTTAEAEAMGITDLLAKYTTEYWGSSNRRQNVRVATEYCSDILMAPGDEFNVDEQIGPRTAARGFLTAPGIVGPGKLEDVYGGGICQVSTTLFNAVFFAGLKVVERWNHSIYIDHYPKGRDATVTADGKNMRFQNDMQSYIWVVGESTGSVTTFYIYGKSDGRKVSYTTSDFYNVVGRTQVTVLDPSKPVGYQSVETGGQSGKQCVVTRTITWADGTTTEEKFSSYWPMIPRKTIVGSGTTTTGAGTTMPGVTTTTPPASTTTTEPPSSSSSTP